MPDLQMTTDGGVEIKLKLTKDQFESWKKCSDEKNWSMEFYITDCVEGAQLRSEMLKYLDDRSKDKPWWKKRYYLM